MTTRERTGQGGAGFGWRGRAWVGYRGSFGWRGRAWMGSWGTHVRCVGRKL